MDTELTKLTEDLAAKVTTNGSKKITVLDLTDLQGGSSELGKYIAEQLTVDFVMSKRDFAVLDRANLKSILAEHKLTATGLVDPENAKQLGKFAGVDALIIGNIIPIGSNINLTVKIITTETAEVVGAAKAKFKADDTVQQFLSQPAKTSDSTEVGQQETPNPTKQIGNLCVVLNSLTGLNDGTYLLGITFQNKNSKNKIAVAMYHDVCYMPPCSLRTSMVAGDGTQFQCNDSGLTGIQSTRFSPVPLTEVDSNGEIKASVKFFVRGGISQAIKSLTFQSEIVVNQNYNAHAYDNYRLDQNSLPPGCKVENVVLEIPLSK
jgi:TolB-like protein